MQLTISSVIDFSFLVAEYDFSLKKKLLSQIKTAFKYFIKSCLVGNKMCSFIEKKVYFFNWSGNSSPSGLDKLTTVRNSSISS